MTPPDPKANEQPDPPDIWAMTEEDRLREMRKMPTVLRSNKYAKPFGRGDCRHDVYDVLDAFGVTCPATAHAVKKLLCAGQRGHKDRLTDLQEAAAALTRAVELEGEGSK